MNVAMDILSLENFFGDVSKCPRDYIYVRETGVECVYPRKLNLQKLMVKIDHPQKLNPVKFSRYIHSMETWKLLSTVTSKYTVPYYMQVLSCNIVQCDVCNTDFD